MLTSSFNTAALEALVGLNELYVSAETIGNRLSGSLADALTHINTIVESADSIRILSGASGTRRLRYEARKRAIMHANTASISCAANARRPVLVSPGLASLASAEDLALFKAPGAESVEVRAVEQLPLGTVRRSS